VVKNGLKLEAGSFQVSLAVRAACATQVSIKIMSEDHIGENTSGYFSYFLDLKVCEIFEFHQSLLLPLQ
jgi:hypothetical protein